jgi:plasmid stabilization system protein ParE
MKVRLLKIASDELSEALAWYQVRSPRVAEDLWLRVRDAKRSILLYPLASPLIAQRVRRFILSGFPYDLVYVVLDKEILIVALAHHSRQPRYWKSRLQNKSAN